MAGEPPRTVWEHDEVRKEDVVPFVKEKLVHITDASPDLLADYIYELLVTNTWDGNIQDEFVKSTIEFLDVPDARSLIHQILEKFPPRKSFQENNGQIQQPQKSAAEKKQKTLQRITRMIEVKREKERQEMKSLEGPSRKRSYHQSEDNDDAQYGSTARSSKRRAQVSRPSAQSDNGIYTPGLNNAPQPFNNLSQRIQHVNPLQPLSGPTQTNFAAQAFNQFGQYVTNMQNQPLNYGAAMAMLQSMAHLAEISRNMAAAATASQSTGSTNGQIGNSAPQCPAFTANGFCPKGPSCPFSHGNTMTVTAPPAPVMYDPTAPAKYESTGTVMYDPTAPVFTFSAPSQKHLANSHDHHHNAQPSFKGLAWASNHPAPQPGGYNQAIVVLRIPSQQCNEQQIRTALSRFGKIMDLIVHTADRRAIVRYYDMESAQKAFDYTNIKAEHVNGEDGQQEQVQEAKEVKKPLFNDSRVYTRWYRPDRMSEDEWSDGLDKGLHIPLSKPWDNITATFDREAALAKIAQDQKKFEERQRMAAYIRNIEQRANLRQELRSRGHEPGDDPEVVKMLRIKVAMAEEEQRKVGRAFVMSGSYESRSTWVWRPPMPTGRGNSGEGSGKVYRTKGALVLDNRVVEDEEKAEKAENKAGEAVGGKMLRKVGKAEGKAEDAAVVGGYDGPNERDLDVADEADYGF